MRASPSCVRSPAKHPQLVIERIDVIDTKMIRAVAEKYRNQPIDVLINNAAAVEASFQADMEKVNQPYDKIDFDAALYDFNVTTLGPDAHGAGVHAERRALEAEEGRERHLARGFADARPARRHRDELRREQGGAEQVLGAAAEQVKPKGVIVALVQPVFIASKAGMENIKAAAPVDQEIAKLIKIIDTMGMERWGRITNFSTGEYDPF